MKGWLATATYAVVLSSTGLALAPAAAADATTEALLACANESDDAKRLRCFDSAVADLRRAARPASGASSGAETPKPAAAPTSAAAAAPASSAPALSAEEKFGARGDLKPDDQLKEITATVTELASKPYGEYVITLDNGQVWAEITRSKIKLKPGDSVRIEAGALGSFTLIAPNGRSSKVSRIR